VAVETAVNRGLDAAVQRLKQRDDRQRGGDAGQRIAGSEAVSVL
jgi:hypothetical protein